MYYFIELHVPLSLFYTDDTSPLTPHPHPILSSWTFPPQVQSHVLIPSLLLPSPEALHLSSWSNNPSPLSPEYIITLYQWRHIEGRGFYFPFSLLPLPNSQSPISTLQNCSGCSVLLLLPCSVFFFFFYKVEQINFFILFKGVPNFDFDWGCS